MPLPIAYRPPICAPGIYGGVFTLPSGTPYCTEKIFLRPLVGPPVGPRISPPDPIHLPTDPMCPFWSPMYSCVRFRARCSHVSVMGQDVSGCRPVSDSADPRVQQDPITQC
jgi:hypothetical protein